MTWVRAGQKHLDVWPALLFTTGRSPPDSVCARSAAPSSMNI